MLNTHTDTLRQHLAMTGLSYKQFQEAGYPFPKAGFLLEELVSRKGLPYERKQRPSWMSSGTPKECFRNTFLRLEKLTRYPALLHAEYGYASDWFYVEGFCMDVSIQFPFLHAWLADPEGNAIDCTIADDREMVYIGIPFALEVVRECIMRTHAYGLLDTGRGLNLPLLNELSPDLLVERGFTAAQIKACIRGGSLAYTRCWR